MSSSADDVAALDALRRDYQRLLQRLEANQQTFNRLARSVYQVQEDERRRLARELHDGLGQNLTALSHLLGMLADGLPDSAEPQRQLARQALEVCRGTLEDTRQLSRLLRPQILDDLGLVAALRWLCRSMQASAGITCTLEADGEWRADSEIETVLFRVAQEGLTNAVRHSGASCVALRVHVTGPMVELEVQDDGNGPGSRDLFGGGGGLSGLRERLRLHDGQLLVRAAQPQGLRLLARLPLPPQAPGGAQ
ncbi:sensor histidine kinase [Pseudomarimonas salicorniae]|uniref:histidine kinase n=1 Tax=Pseudomarimonas salicorniae TaxID=2933270 RepID=A0ABT0GK62_9GAMM|nr:sensor histidine kinase [Lysobacter sp. CAU 1642]MCK7594405.1 sensor histidine kinase [Lysobacter sp. CAU 1642]